MRQKEKKNLAVFAVIALVAFGVVLASPYLLQLSVGPAGSVTAFTFNNQTAAKAPVTANLQFSFCPSINPDLQAYGCPYNTTTGYVTLWYNWTCTTGSGIWTYATSQPISIAQTGPTNSTTPSYTDSQNWQGNSGLFGISGDICTFNMPTYYSQDQNVYYPQYGGNRGVTWYAGPVYEIVGSQKILLGIVSVSIPATGTVPSILGFGINPNAGATTSISTTTTIVSTTTTILGGGGGGNGASTTVTSGSTTTIPTTSTAPTGILAQIEAWFAGIWQAILNAFKI